jgi:hypothetical protein
VFPSLSTSTASDHLDSQLFTPKKVFSFRVANCDGSTSSSGVQRETARSLRPLTASRNAEIAKPAETASGVFEIEPSNLKPQADQRVLAVLPDFKSEEDLEKLD